MVTINARTDQSHIKNIRRAIGLLTNVSGAIGLIKLKPKTMGKDKLITEATEYANTKTHIKGTAHLRYQIEYFLNKVIKLKADNKELKKMIILRNTEIAGLRGKSYNAQNYEKL